MSLINQMLKDLDARRGIVVNAAFAAPQGITLTAQHAARRFPVTRIAAWATGITLLACAGYYGMQWWASSPAQAAAAFEPETPVQIADPPPAATPQADTDVTSPQQIVAAEPATAQPEAEVAQAVTPLALPAVKPVPPTAVVVAEPRPIKTISPEQEADRLFARAERALALQQTQDAETLLRQALSEYPQHLNARTRLAALRVANGDQAAAEALLAPGGGIGNHRLELVKPYAQLLAARDALEEALAALDSVADRGNTDAEWHALRAAVLYRLKRHGESADAYQRALQRGPDEALWWTGLAVAREHNMQPREALGAYRRAARLQLTSAVRDYVNQRIQALQNRDGS